MVTQLFRCYERAVFDSAAPRMLRCNVWSSPDTRNASFLLSSHLSLPSPLFSLFSPPSLLLTFKGRRHAGVADYPAARCDDSVDDHTSNAICTGDASDNIHLQVPPLLLVLSSSPRTLSLMLIYINRTYRHMDTQTPDPWSCAWSPHIDAVRIGYCGMTSSLSFTTLLLLFLLLF